MTDPILSTRNSGFFGRGYALPTRPNLGDLDSKGEPRPTKYPGITTVTGALDKGGVVQWAVDLTAAYAVANVQDLAERESDWGFRRLRFYHQRKPDYDSPETNINNFHAGVLDDLASQGTIIHSAIEAFIKDDPFGFPEWTRWEQEEAFGCFLDWAEENVEEFLSSESTVFNPDAGYAGTGDIWARLKDKPGIWYLDVKSARKVHPSHIMQGAAIQRAGVEMVEDENGVPYKGRKWAEKPAQTVDRVGVLQVRQRSVDEYGREIPAFCKLTEFTQPELDAAYEQFLGALQARRGQAKLRDVQNAISKREKEDAVEYFQGRGMSPLTCEEGCDSRPYRRGKCAPCYREGLRQGDYSRASIAGPLNPRWKGGASTHPLNDMYWDMMGRCGNPKHARYADYGGRGISVHPEWAEDFWAFVRDVGERPEGKTQGGRAYWQLDRVDNFGNYEPGNVRWTTPEVQARNKRGFGDFESRRDRTTGRFT